MYNMLPYMHSNVRALVCNAYYACMFTCVRTNTSICYMLLQMVDLSRYTFMFVLKTQLTIGICRRIPAYNTFAHIMACFLTCRGGDSNFSTLLHTLMHISCSGFQCVPMHHIWRDEFGFENKKDAACIKH